MVFSGYFIITSILYTVIFSYLPHIVEVVKKIWERRRVHAAAPPLNDNEEPLPLNAFVTLVCFFLQVASLVHVEAQTRNIQDTSKSQSDASLKSVFDFFNFRIAIYRRVCPTDELTLTMKESIKVGLKLCSIFNLFIFYVIWKVFVYLSKLAQRVENNEEESGEVAHRIESTQSTKISFATITKIGFLKLGKLNFTSISTYTLHMIHCVSVGGQLRLYLYGDLPCYNWWQWIILFVLLPLIVLFPFSFGVSLKMLKERSISPSMFLLSSMIPYITLMLWISKKMGWFTEYIPSDEDEQCIIEILQLEDELFKENDRVVRWPIIQLYRNLLIVALNTFILNPIYKTVAVIPVFLAFAVHDCLRKPFKHVYLNNLQILTSVCLLIISVCYV